MFVHKLPNRISENCINYYLLSFDLISFNNATGCNEKELKEKYRRQNILARTVEHSLRKLYVWHVFNPEINDYPNDEPIDLVWDNHIFGSIKNYVVRLQTPMINVGIPEFYRERMNNIDHPSFINSMSLNLAGAIVYYQNGIPFPNVGGYVAIVVSIRTKNLGHNPEYFLLRPTQMELDIYNMSKV